MSSNTIEEILCEENGYQLVVERSSFSDTEENVIEVEMTEDDTVEERLQIDEEKLSTTLKRFLKSYVQSKKENENLNLEQWLVQRLQEEFPEKEKETVQAEARQLIEGVELGRSKYENVKQKRQLGLSVEDILATDIAKSTIGQSKEEVKEELEISTSFMEKENIRDLYHMAEGIEIAPKVMAFQKMTKYFDGINETIAQGNEKMMQAITTKAGAINQNPQLDGFIFEQFHENTFNLDAAIKDIHNVRAEVLVPKAGEAYGKNSVDLVVKVRRGNQEKIVQKYQAKVSKNAEQLFKRGNYRFQRKLYGAELEQVGNTKVQYGNVESKAISKQEVKQLQIEVQKGNTEVVKQSFEKDVNVKLLSKQLARQTIVSAGIGMGVGMLASTGTKLIQGEQVEAEDVIVDGLKVAGSNGISTAIAGGLKTAVEKGIIKGSMAKILGNNTVIGVIAYSAVSLIGVAYSVGSGDMSLKDGMKETGGILAGTYGGIKGAMVGTALAGGIIASVGTILAPVVAVVAGTIGAIAGTTIGSAIGKGVVAIGNSIATGVKKVAKSGWETVKGFARGVGDTIKSVGSTVASGLRSFGSAVSSGFSSFCSGVASFFGW